MKAVFLCGGIGKRMFPLTKDKFMLKFLGKELLLHHVAMAEKCGINEFVVVGNPHNIDEVKRLLGGKAVYAVQKKPMGMADALLSAKGILRDDKILVVNPNDVFDAAAYETVLDKYKASNADAVMLGYEVKEYFPGGYLIAEDDKVRGVVEKPGVGNEPSNLVNIGVHFHRDVKTLFEYLEKTTSKRDDTYERALDRMAKDGFDFRVARYSGPWIAIKYPWNILDTARHFLDGIDKTKVSGDAQVSERAHVEGKLIIESGVKVLENAVIRGPCYIGKNTVVGNHVLVRDYCHIGDRVVIGSFTELKNSYVGDDTWFHMNYIGDSVIGERCNFGAGTKVGNLRFDGKNVRVKVGGIPVDTGRRKFGAVIADEVKTGLNSVINPGLALGPNSVLGPGVVLYKDLAPNKCVTVEQQLKETHVDERKTGV